MNDQPGRCFQIVLTINAEVRELGPQPCERPNVVPLDIEVNLREPNPSQNFELVAVGHHDWITGSSGPEQIIDLSQAKGSAVQIRFILKGQTGLMFPSDIHQAFGIVDGDLCPNGPCNANPDVFALIGGNTSELTLRRKTADGNMYGLALFLQGPGMPHVSCDPRIINK